ncbi:MAG: alkJ, pSRTUE45c [Solirubrobacterales bacterium]|nr:alkJ, pSRTUE45c [Solirubrobacterales bacterium]
MDTYDYVIVGAGSAGCVVAARLSEDPDVRVLLLEAGPSDEDPLIHLPLGFGSLFKSEFDWDDASEPEARLNGRRIPLSHGRVLGGSSSTNAMMYVRGNPADFDGWADLGLDGWGYADVLPYFLRSEDNDRFKDAFHGRGGPLGVSDSRAMTPCIDVMIEAGHAAGLPLNDDCNGARQEGIGRLQSTTRDGQRCSAAVAFLRPAMARPNLEVVTDATALGILFEGTRASGIVYERFGVRTEVRATREVVLSGGAYGTPQLLLLSGIGPAEELQALGIAVREDLPVGRNLQDHCMLPLTFFAAGGTLESAGTPQDVERYEREQRGPLASNVGEAGAFAHTRSGLPAPDLQLSIAPVMVHEDLLGPAFASAVSMSPTVVKPESRGSVTLRAARAKVKPRIRHRYLEAEEDRRTMAEGVRLVLGIAEQAAFRALTTGVHNGPASDSDADVAAFIAQGAHTVWHPVGTCAMGAVVDAELRVLGVDGLRVVDASVMPSIPRANTNAASILVGEKGADLIRGRSRIEQVPASATHTHVRLTPAGTPE